MLPRLRILTWHVHGNYLLYLSQAPHDFYLPVKADKTDGYGGRGGSFPFADNVIEIPAEQVRHTTFDCILFQSAAHWRTQDELLSPAQQRLPRIFLEHDPPQQHPTDTRHIVQDREVLLVHVTHFNQLMWDAGITPTHVIEHGVELMQEARYSGELERGIVVINNLATRGRRLGIDVFQQARQAVPLDLVGMEAEALNGLGEIFPPDLPQFMARYRFFFNPIRYTSLGLAVIEAMMVGLPIVGLATTEMVTAIENGVAGFVSTQTGALVEVMHDLLRYPAEARRLGEGARRTALERFNIERFVRDWNETLATVTGHPRKVRTASAQATGAAV